MILKLKSILFSMKKRGITKTMKMVIYELFFDLLYKVETSGHKDLFSLDIRPDTKFYNIANSSIYEPSNQLSLKKAFSFLDEYCDLSKKTLLDFGCGKGRVLIYASKYNFKNLIGVDFANDLCNVAKDNMNKIKLNNTQIINQDATEFLIPNIVDIFYFYNPFLGKTFKSVLDNIDNFCDSNPNKKIIIVYIIAVCKDMFDLDKYKIIYEVDGEFIIFERIIH